MSLTVDDVRYFSVPYAVLGKKSREAFAVIVRTTLFIFYKNIFVFPTQAEYSHFSEDFRLKIRPTFLLSKLFSVWMVLE